MTLDAIRAKVKAGSYRFRIHCVERCVERNISPEEVREIVLGGELIEEYPEDKYGPSCLICGTTGKGRILHVQVSCEPVWGITAYDPTLMPHKWDASFTQRRKI